MITKRELVTKLECFPDHFEVRVMDGHFQEQQITDDDLETGVDEDIVYIPTLPA